MRILKFIILSAFMLMGITLHAQERTISGKVLDVREHSVIGAAVMLEGTNHGVTTSLDGSFSITVPKGDVVLNVSSIGYITTKINVPANKNYVTIFMQDDIIQLESAVVVGYGTQKRVNLTGAVSTVESDKLENHLSHSVTNMLQGSVAGLNVTTSSGRPGATGAINIRGVNSINSAAPLVVIDGVTGNTGDLNRLNPNDVDNISAIKDAPAAIYGARAARLFGNYQTGFDKR